MEIELICRDCDCYFAAPAEASEEEIVRRMTDQGPWYGLGDGECFQDMIRTALGRRGRITCPECGGVVLVRSIEVIVSV